MVLDQGSIIEERDIHKRESIKGRNIWYDLSPYAVVGDFIFPSKIFEVYGLFDNRNAKIFCDKVNYAINVKEEFKEYSDSIFLLMNSISFRFLLDLFSRQMAGSLSDIDVNVTEKTLLLNPTFLNSKKKQLDKILASLKSRSPLPIHQEILQKDKRDLDILIFEAIGLTEKDVDELYREASTYVSRKKKKTDSVITKKSKGHLTTEDANELIRERFSEIRNYASLIENVKTLTFNIPDWDAKYPKGYLGSDNLFGHYDVYFKQGNKQQKLSFTNPMQLILFRFLNETIELKGQKINLPLDEKDCNEILTTLKVDFDETFPQIKSLLKSHRSKANAISIYRTLLLS